MTVYDLCLTRMPTVSHIILMTCLFPTSSSSSYIILKFTIGLDIYIWF